MPALQRSLRLFALILTVLAGVLLTLLMWPASRRFHLKVAGGWHRTLARILALRVHVHGATLQPGSLITANHISWLDILVLGGQWPVLFLSKSEVRKWPLIGFLAARAGTLFLHRGRGASEAAQEITQALRQQCNVVLFPEGTTTDGAGVRRFHSRLLQAAVDAQRPVQPLAIRYREPDGSRAARAAYIDDMSLWHSLQAILRGGPIHVEVELFPPIPASEDRRQLARQAEARVRQAVTGQSAGETTSGSIA